MIRVLHRLTPSIVKTAGEGLHSDGGNLCLQCTVGSDGGIRRSWIFRYAKGGKEHQMGLGPVHTISLADARQEATELRKALYRGQDPLAQRNAARASAALETAKAVTFDKCCDAYVKAHSAGWRSAKHAAQWTSTLKTYADPVFGKIAVQAVDVALLMKALEPIWTTNPVTASRLRGRIEAVLDWAKVRGFRSGQNPARWKGHLDHLLPAKGKVAKVVHHAALPYAEVPKFMKDLKARESFAALALEFTILTAARSGETIGAPWSEIDLAAKLWTIPAERMKGGREHRVPLSDPVLAILAKMETFRLNEYVFPGEHRATMSGLVMAKALSRLNPSVVVHGFRASFKTWAEETTNYPNAVIEMALSHKVGNAVEAAYMRGDLFNKRRALMADWAGFCG
jgi:integrase